MSVCYCVSKLDSSNQVCVSLHVYINWTLPTMRGSALLLRPLHTALTEQGGLVHFLAAAKGGDVERERERLVVRAHSCK